MAFLDLKAKQTLLRGASECAYVCMCVVIGVSGCWQENSKNVTPCAKTL